MTTGPFTLTVGWTSRHTPPGAGVDGRDAAVIDIAQDLLLRDLHERGSLDALVFKGGTSLRKLLRRQSRTVLPGSRLQRRRPHQRRRYVVVQLVSDIDGTTIGPFTYGVTERRGRWSLTIQSPFGTDESTLSSKLDVSPPPWLEPVRRGWVRMPIHATYGAPSLPKLQVVRLEGNIAEKISRLNRTTTARDLYDLAWLVTHQRDIGNLDTDLIRRMVALKIWVDAHGVTAGSVRWKAGHEPRPFDPNHWLRTLATEEVDLADIGALAVPTPSLADLNATIQAHYGFLRQLDPDERQLAETREQERHLALRLLNELPGARLASLCLY